MGGLLSILLIIVLFFYAYSIIIKLIFRHKMKKIEKEMHKNGFEEPKEKEQKIHVDPNIGEYTDFEEIE